MKKTLAIVFLTFVMMQLSSCEEGNLFGAFLGNSVNCKEDSVCFVEALFALKGGNTPLAENIANNITDDVKRNFLFEMIASVKVGGVVGVLDVLTSQAEEGFSLQGLGEICPSGTLTDSEIDTLLESDQGSHRMVGRVCLATEALTDNGALDKLLTELVTSAQEILDGIEDSTLGTIASAQDLCQEISPTNDPECADVTSGVLKTYLETFL